MTDILHRSFDVHTRGVDESNRSATFICSTTSVDSHGDVVEQDWDLSRYKKNPVVLYGHNRSGFLGLGGDPDHTLPIGFATELNVRSKQLEATIQFVDASANPLAEKVWQGVRQGSIRAVSVGFRPHSVEQRKGDDGYLLSQNELYEISVVPIGSNADAVRKAADAERADLRSWLRRHADGQSNAPTVSEFLRELDDDDPVDDLFQSAREKQEEAAELQRLSELFTPPKARSAPPTIAEFLGELDD